jgi:hypothetical protein
MYDEAAPEYEKQKRFISFAQGYFMDDLIGEFITEKRLVFFGFRCIAT